MILENQDGTHADNEGGEGTEVVENQSVSNEELTALREKAERAEQLERENGSLKRELKKAQKEPKETPEQSTPQSNEPDYARLAYLKAEGVTHPDDQKLVEEEASRLKLPLTDVLQMDYIKSRLESNQNQRVSQNAMPDGSGRKGGPNKGEVDYYLAHPEEVPEDLELHEKVIRAKMTKIENDGKFASVPYIG